MERTILHIIRKYINGTYTTKEAEHFFEEIHDSSVYQQVSAEMNQIWKDSESLESPAFKREQYYTEALELIRQLEGTKKRRFLLSNQFVRYAVAVIVLLVVVTGIYINFNNRQPEDLLWTELVTQQQETQHLILPDGSRIFLNVSSTVRYPEQFGKHERLIYLDGEGFFEIEKDPERPFIILAGETRLEVLGTSFNLKAYEEDAVLSVSVETGMVQVDMPDAMVRLNPNEWMQMDKIAGEFQKRNENSNHLLSWMQGALNFDKTPIQLVVKELERVYGCKIVFDPRFEYKEYIYGQHDNKSLESVLKSIEYATGIKHYKENNMIILHK